MENDVVMYIYIFYCGICAWLCASHGINLCNIFLICIEILLHHFFQVLELY